MSNRIHRLIQIIKHYCAAIKWCDGAIRTRVLLSFILLIGAFLRLYDLSHNPPGLYCDEASVGANAYSIGTSGRDLTGEFLPLYCDVKSFEAWGVDGIVTKPVLQYATVPFVFMLGRTNLAVRLPAVCFGLLGIVAIFLLARNLFDNPTGLVAATLLAISPWHHHYSRIAFDGTALVALLALAVFYLQRGLERPANLIVGCVFLGITTYAYPAANVTVPLLLIGFTVLNRATIRRHWRHALVGVAALAVIEIPNMYLILTDTSQERAHQLVLWSANLDAENAVRFLTAHEGGGGLSQFILGHRALLVLFVFIWKYFAYLSPQFLFLEGDPNLRHGVFGFGVFLWFWLPLLLVGLLLIVRNWKVGNAKFLLFWLVIYPIPASLTIDDQHASRAIVGLPILTLIAAHGLVGLIRFSRFSLRSRDRATPKAIAAKTVAVVILLAMPLETVSYVTHYHRSYPRYSASWWQHGVRDALAASEKLSKDNGKVFVSGNIFNSYIFIMFYSNIDFHSLESSRSLNAQLSSSGYVILQGNGPNSGGTNDLWLLTADDLPLYPSLEVIEEFPFPNDKPNLFLATKRSSHE